MAELPRDAPRQSSLGFVQTDKGSGPLPGEKVLLMIPLDLVSLNSHVTSQRQADVRKLSHSPIPYVRHDLTEI